MNEQEVRTRAGWIGVEISRSRVRTAGKAGYGLYRVRAMPQSTDLPEDLDEMWTAYAFRLDAIEANVRWAIEQGTPSGPAPMDLMEDITMPAIDGKRRRWVVPTRWTSAYQGRRDLGCVPVAVRPEYAAELDALVALIDAGLVVMEHEDGWCGCEGMTKLTARCVRRTLIGLPPAMVLRCQNETEPEGEQCRGTVRIGRGEPQGQCDTCGAWHGRYAPYPLRGLSADLEQLERTDPAVGADLRSYDEMSESIRSGTVRSRQRAANAEFQAVHKVARDHGLKKRHAAKLARLSNPVRPPAERPAAGLEGSGEGVAGADPSEAF